MDQDSHSIAEHPLLSKKELAERRMRNVKVMLTAPIIGLALYGILSKFNQQINPKIIYQLANIEPLKYESIMFDDEYGYWDLCTTPVGEIVDLAELFRILKNI